MKTESVWNRFYALSVRESGIFYLMWRIKKKHGNSHADSRGAFIIDTRAQLIVSSIVVFVDASQSNADLIMILLVDRCILAQDFSDRCPMILSCVNN